MCICIRFYNCIKICKDLAYHIHDERKKERKNDVLRDSRARAPRKHAIRGTRILRKERKKERKNDVLRDSAKSRD